MCNTSCHPNNSFHDDIENVKASPSTWCCLCDCVLTIASFFFSSYLSSPLKTHVGYLKLQNSPFIYWCFNFGPYFLFFIFVLGPLLIFFQFYPWIHNCDLFFFKKIWSLLFWFFFYFLDPLWIWFFFSISPFYSKF